MGALTATAASNPRRPPSGDRLSIGDEGHSGQSARQHGRPAHHRWAAARTL